MFLKVAFRAGDHDVVGSVCPAAREWDDVVDVIGFAHFSLTVVAFTALALVLGSNALGSDGIIGLRAQSSTMMYCLENFRIFAAVGFHSLQFPIPITNIPILIYLSSCLLSSFRVGFLPSLRFDIVTFPVFLVVLSFTNSGAFRIIPLPLRRTLPFVLRMIQMILPKIGFDLFLISLLIDFRSRCFAWFAVGRQAIYPLAIAKEVFFGGRERLTALRATSHQWYNRIGHSVISLCRIPLNVHFRIQGLLIPSNYTTEGTGSR